MPYLTQMDGLNYDKMKTKILTLTILLFIFISTKHIYSQQAYYEIFNSYKIGNYTFFEGKTASDTIVFVGKTKLFDSCNQKVIYIQKQNLKQISNLKINERVFYFMYKVLDTNNHLLVETSELPPGENRKYSIIHTYRQYPFYIENCLAIYN